MKAILLPYTCDQNEPSRPVAQIIELPNETKPRNLYLKLLFIKHVNEDADIREVTIQKGKKYDYGDIIVEGPYDQFLYVTLIKDTLSESIAEGV